MNDQSPMPFGKHAGEPMEKVPVSYLHWFWENADEDRDDSGEVLDYIKRQMRALEREAPDRIWKKR